MDYVILSQETAPSVHYTSLLFTIPAAQRVTTLAAGAATLAAYSVNGTTVTANGDGKITIRNAWLGTTISLVKKGNGTATVDGAGQSITLSARPAAPACTATQPSASSATGTVSGITSEMQHSTDRCMT